MVTLEEAGAESIGTSIATINPDDVGAFGQQFDGWLNSVWFAR